MTAAVEEAGAGTGTDTVLVWDDWAEVVMTVGAVKTCEIWISGQVRESLWLSL